VEILWTFLRKAALLLFGISLLASFGSTALFMGHRLPVETWGIVFILALVVLTISSTVLIPGVFLPSITSPHPEFLTDDLEDEWIELRLERCRASGPSSGSARDSRFGRDLMPRLARVLIVACALIPMIASLPPAGAQTPMMGLVWSPCATPFATTATPVVDPAKFPPGLQCATLSVPLDYRQPEGEQIAIGLNRLAALDPKQRIGSLVFNPGGPGGATTDINALEALGASLFTPDVRAHFDIVGMDPRGVGASTPVRCDPGIWNQVVSWFPRDDASFTQLREHYRAFGESCLRLTGPLLGHLDTTNVARDLESVRAAWGEGKLNFLGLSYGSQLGAAYAEHYPDNVRVMALDGALDHVQQASSMLADEAGAYEDAFGRFARWCAEEQDCALNGRDVSTFFDDLVQQADQDPIPAPRCVELGFCRPTVTGEDIRFNMQGLILIKDPVPELGIREWPGLAIDLVSADAGDASQFSIRIASDETSRDFAALAIECLDWDAAGDTFADHSAKQFLGRTVAPHTQGATQTWTVLAGCMDWPVPVANPPHLADVRGVPPILLVNATHDPSTAYEWAHALRDQIDGSVLLT
jgi:pimeloyl-ACP methyl ester carboxylesterase